MQKQRAFDHRKVFMNGCHNRLYLLRLKKVAVWGRQPSLVCYAALSTVRILDETRPGRPGCLQRAPQLKLFETADIFLDVACLHTAGIDPLIVL